MNSPVLYALKKGIPVVCGGYTATLIAFNPELPAPIMCAVRTGKDEYGKGLTDPYKLESFALNGKSLNPMVSDLRVRGWL